MGLRETGPPPPPPETKTGVKIHLLLILCVYHGVLESGIVGELALILNKTLFRGEFDSLVYNYHVTYNQHS